MQIFNGTKPIEGVIEVATAITDDLTELAIGKKLLLPGGWRNTVSYTHLTLPTT